MQVRAYATIGQGRHARRLRADLHDLDQRLEACPRPVGLRARSVHGFLSALRAHKQEMLDDLQ